jgi:hypothetical protein
VTTTAQQGVVGIAVGAFEPVKALSAPKLKGSERRNSVHAKFHVYNPWGIGSIFFKI